MSVRTVEHEALKGAIINVLRGSVLQTINFSYVSPALGGQTLHWSAAPLSLVAQRIETGAISVGLFVRRAERSPHGFYTFGDNRLVISSDSWFSAERNSIIVHECVHASQDIYGVQMPTVDVELTAFLTQTIYSLRTNLPLLRYLPNFRAAAETAMRGERVGESEIEKLYAFISRRYLRHKIHMRIPCGNDWCYKWLAYDGVPE